MVITVGVLQLENNNLPSLKLGKIPENQRLEDEIPWKAACWPVFRGEL